MPENCLVENWHELVGVKIAGRKLAGKNAGTNAGGELVCGELTHKPAGV